MPDVPDGPENITTLYYRSGTAIVQGSGSPYPDVEPWSILRSSGSKPSFSGSPSVVGGVPFEAGRHWVMGVDTNSDVWFIESKNDAQLLP